MNACLSTDFVLSYLYSVFTELNMMVVRLTGATSLRYSKSSDVLAQWMSSSPFIRARLTEAMDHGPLPAVLKFKVQAICTYAEALFPAPYLIGLLLELGAPRFGFRVLSEYVMRQGDAYTARTGLPFPRPIPTRDQFDATWKSLTAPLVLSPPVECADPPLSGRCWPLRSWAQYVQSRPAVCQSIDCTRPPSFVVRGDGYPCTGGCWSQLSVGLLNHGVKARTPAFLWVVGMHVMGDKDTVALGQIWTQVLQVCSLHFRVHMLFIICAFIIRKMPS